jgi:glutathione S-transferase
VDHASELRIDFVLPADTAPVATRFNSHDVSHDSTCAAYARHIMTLPDMVEWIDPVGAEPDALEELDVEF